MPIPVVRHRTRFPRRRLVAAVVAFALVAAVLASLGGGAGDRDDAAVEAQGNTVAVTAVDGAFLGLPSSVPAGSRLQLTNASTTEAHEIVAYRLPGGTDATGADPVALAAEPPAGDPVAVLVAGPNGGPQVTALGDGTLAEPGQYLLADYVPTGADPDAYVHEARTLTPRPDVPGGEPHAASGMAAVLTVTP